MDLIEILIVMLAACGVATAVPLDSSSIAPVKEVQADDAPRCGYVRLHEGDWPIIGIYSRAVCESIWNDEEATIYRIDEAGCSCKFFASKESCEKGDIVPTYTGPETDERKFEGTKPKYIYCQTTES